MARAVGEAVRGVCGASSELHSDSGCPNTSTTAGAGATDESRLAATGRAAVVAAVATNGEATSCKESSTGRRAVRKTGERVSAGKIKFKRAKRNHILEKRSKKMKRQARSGGILNDEDARHIKRLLPN